MRLQKNRSVQKNSRPKGGCPRSGNKVSVRRRGTGDNHLLNLMKEGNPDALTIIMKAYNDRLFAIANRICSNPADAEEVVQDVYMTAFEKIDQFEGRSMLSTWLHRITVNMALMHLRSQRLSKNTVPMEDLPALLGEDENVLRMDEEVRSPVDTYLTKELHDQIRASVKTLPDIYQSAFYLRDIQGFSIKEASEMLHTTPATIKSRLHRSRFRIKEKLEAYLDMS